MILFRIFNTKDTHPMQASVVGAYPSLRLPNGFHTPYFLIRPLVNNQILNNQHIQA